MPRSHKRVVVVGGGTIGLYVASRLAESGPVTVIEPAAGLPSVSSRQLFGNVTNPGGHDGLTTAWTSAWGGTSNLWGGQLLPWEDWEIDGSVGQRWPIEFADIEPKYEVVRRNLGISSHHSVIHRRRKMLPGSEDPGVTLRYSTWMTPKQRNMSTNRSLSRNLGKVERCHGWIVERVLGTGPFEIFTKSLTGESRRLTASRVVFAAGVLGNSKILANSYPELTAIGAGFMDHLSSRVAKYHVTNWKKFLGFAGQRYDQGVRSSPKIVLAPGVLTQEKIHPGYAHWEFSLEDSELARWTKLSRKRPPNARAIGEGMEVTRSAFEALVHRQRIVPRFATVYLRVDVEQRPEASRRLSWNFDESEASLCASWSMSDSERDSARRIGEIVTSAIDEDAVGARRECASVPDFIDTKHLMGGAPMGTDTSNSVTDTFGRVHGTEDAWIVGASVFPTGGIANPTFTALALAERTLGEMNEL